MIFPFKLFPDGSSILGALAKAIFFALLGYFILIPSKISLAAAKTEAKPAWLNLPGPLPPTLKPGFADAGKREAELSGNINNLDGLQKLTLAILQVGMGKYKQAGTLLAEIEPETKAGLQAGKQTPSVTGTSSAGASSAGASNAGASKEKAPQKSELELLYDYHLFFSGVCALKAGKLKTALKFLVPVAGKGSTFPAWRDAAVMCSVILEMLGEPEKALRILEPLLKTQSARPKAAMLLRGAVQAASLKEYQKSEKWLKELLSEFPETKSSQTGTAFAQYLKDSALIDFAPKDDQFLLLQARKLVEKRQNNQALNLLGALEKTLPPALLPEVLYLRGRVFHHQRKSRDAITVFDTFKEKYPGNDLLPQVLLAEARALWRLGDSDSVRKMEDGLQEIRKNNALEPVSFQAGRLLLALFTERARYEDALNLIDDILKEAEDRREQPAEKNRHAQSPEGEEKDSHVLEAVEIALWNRGLLQIVYEDFVGAKVTLERFIENYPKSKNLMGAHYWLGKAFYGLKDSKQAGTHFAFCARSGPHGYYGILAARRLLAMRDKKELAYFQDIREIIPAAKVEENIICPDLTRNIQFSDATTEVLTRAGLLVRMGLPEMAEWELAEALKRSSSDAAALEKLPEKQKELNDSRLIFALRHAEVTTQLGRHMAASADLWRAFGSCLLRGSAADLMPIKEMLFPRKHEEAIVEALKGTNILPEIIYSLIRQESFFEARAVSGAGAVGLMQLMPATAKQVAAKLGLPAPGVEALKNPELNIKLGIAYFKMKMERFGRLSAALCSYNAGEGRLRLWITHHKDLDEETFIEFIPYTETRDYVKKITAYSHMYKLLYPAPDQTTAPSTPGSQN